MMVMTVLPLVVPDSELMKEDYGEIVRKKSEVFHLCSLATQTLEKTKQL